MKLKRRLLGTLAGAALAIIWVDGLAFAASETVCAVVKIEIAQEMTFERQGFEATLKVSNGLAATALSDFCVDLDYRDADGTVVLGTENTGGGRPVFPAVAERVDGVEDDDCRGREPRVEAADRAGVRGGRG